MTRWTRKHPTERGLYWVAFRRRGGGLDEYRMEPARVRCADGEWYINETWTSCSIPIGEARRFGFDLWWMPDPIAPPSPPVPKKRHTSAPSKSASPTGTEKK